ncbi:MAG: sulfotransferase domain-containing protein [Anaerolineae bacterium]|nr:sulfotransferase domain-containing protein [Anaerolineae bacterium]
MSAISKLSHRIWRSVKYRSAMVFWLATYQQRMKPSFLIIGGQKCGTTSLGEALWQHPQIAPERYKEIRYFSERFYKGHAWYMTHFPLQSQAERAGQTLTLDNTPYYLFHPLAPERVAQFNPDMKLIALLRDPVERTISHYFHNQRRDPEREPLSLMEAIQQEPQRLAGEEARIRSIPDYPALNHRRYSYVGRSLYVEQIKRWRQYFPAEQLLILRSEDLFSHFEQTYTKILDFLELPRVLLSQFIAANRGTNRTQVDPAIRQYLNELFRPHNEALYEYLGRDFAWEE